MPFMYAFCGSITVRGTATPMRAASEYPKNLSSALRHLVAQSIDDDPSAPSRSFTPPILIKSA